MITIPLYLVDIDFTRPLVWNGKSLELADVTYDELNQRIANLKKNRLQLSANIQKIRLDLGQIRKFDLFDIESKIRLLEKQALKLIPLVQYAQNSSINLSVRTESYKELLDLISNLYDKFKGVGDPILAQIDSNSGQIAVFKKKLNLLNPTVIGLNTKGEQLESRLYRIDTMARKLTSQLSDVYNDINMITDNNFQLSKVQAEIENNISIVQSKSKQNTDNIEYVSAKLCDFILKFNQLIIEMDGVLKDMDQIIRDSEFLNNTVNTAKIGLNRLSDSIEILKDFYVDADEKVRAIESYLTSFIVGGDNVHLDFGTDYTIIHAIPPKAPLCPDPEPCPKSRTPVIVTVSPTTTRAPIPTTTSSSGGSTTTARPTTSAPATTTARPTTTTAAPKKIHCFASDNDYVGCFVVYVIRTFKSGFGPGDEYLCDHRFETNDIIAIECYWDTDSRVEAEADAKTTAKIWNTNGVTNDGCNYNFKVAEVQSNSKCRVMDKTDVYEP